MIGNNPLIYTSTAYGYSDRALQPCEIISKAKALQADTVIAADPDTIFD